MEEAKTVALKDYLRSFMEERDMSIRAFATYSGLSHTTIRRLLEGEDADHYTLNALAEYMNIPVLNVYKMAGYIPAQSDVQSLLISEVEHLLSQMSEDEQRMALDLIRAIKRNSPKEG